MASPTFCKLHSSGINKKVNPKYLANNYVHDNLKTRNLSLSPTAPTFMDKARTSGSVGLRSKIDNHHHQCRVTVLKSRAEYADAPTAVADNSSMRKIYINGGSVPEKSKTVKEEEELSRATLIWRAAKLPIYTVALIPVTVASAAAYWQAGVFSWGRYFGILASYVIVTAWVNLSNDVYDYDTGADKDKKESVVNLFGSRNLINNIAWSLLAIGFMGFSGIAQAAKTTRSLVFLINAAFCFFLYQCPPFRLSYYGVGEPLLFVAYGPLSTLGFYLLSSRGSELPITSTITCLSVLVGLTTSLILFCSHFHQIEGDKAVGKISPLVRLGTEMGSHVVKWSVIGLYFLLFALGYTKAIPFPSVVLGAMTIPMGNLVVDFVQKNHKDKSKIFMGKYFVVRLHTIFGLALAAGMVVARKLATQIA